MKRQTSGSAQAVSGILQKWSSGALNEFPEELLKQPACFYESLPQSGSRQLG